MPFVEGMTLVKTSGNQGMQTTGAGTDVLLHDLPLGRSARIVKILAYSDVGAIPLLFGTLTNAAVFVQWFPALLAVNNLESIWEAVDLPSIEFQFNQTAGALGWVGDIYVQAATAGVDITIEVEEKF